MDYELDVRKLSELQSLFGDMLTNCPLPSSGELAKLLSMQGYFWQKLSLMEAHLAEEEMVEGYIPKAKDLARFQKRMKLALEMGREARNCLTSASQMVKALEALALEGDKASACDKDRDNNLGRDRDSDPDRDR